MDELLKILGLTQKATLDDIKKAYRKKAKFYHPDINKSKSAHEEFLKIQEAYNILIAFFEKGEQLQAGKATQEQKSKEGSFYSFYSGAEKKRSYQQYKKKQETEHLNLLQYSFAWLVHILFFFIGITIVIAPIVNIITNGVEDKEDLASSVLAIILTSFIGIVLSIATYFSYRINLKDARK